MSRELKDVEMQSVVAIDIQTLSSSCEENNITHINLLKVDFEEHELAIFKGAQKMLREKRIGCIQFEYGGCNLDASAYLLDLWNYLKPFGFTFYKIYPTELK